MNLFEARVQEYGASVEVGGALWRVGEAQRAALAGRSGAAVTVGVRPEDLHQDEKGVPATLEVVEPLGSETLLYWKSTAGNHVSRATSGETPAVGARATLAARPDGVLLFEPATAPHCSLHGGRRRRKLQCRAEARSAALPRHEPREQWRCAVRRLLVALHHE